MTLSTAEARQVEKQPCFSPAFQKLVPYSLDVYREAGGNGYCGYLREVRCAGFGDTIEELQANIQDLAATFVECCKEDRVPVPCPRPKECNEAKKADPDYVTTVVVEIAV